LKSGSSDNAILNNILIGNNTGYSGAMNISPDSLPGLFSDNNIVSDRFTVDDGGSNMPLTGWQNAEAHDLHSIVVADPATLFVDLANNNYHLSPTSVAINA